MSELSSIGQTSFQNPKELMRVSIDLGNGQTEAVLIREGESPSSIAHNFAQKYSLPESTEFLLREQIEQGISQLKKQSADVSFEEEEEAKPMTSRIHSMDAHYANIMTGSQDLQPIFVQDEEGQDDYEGSSQGVVHHPLTAGQRY